jgi:hypothetical protein
VQVITHSRRQSKLLLVSIAIVLLGFGCIGGYLYATRSTNPIPQDIKGAMTFSPFVVTDNSNGFKTTDYKFTTAEDNTKILTYVVTTQSGTTITVSQYEQPSQFSDIPEYKDRFLSNIVKQYATVQTPSGVIYLGRMAKQNDKQMAIMIEKGLLVLMNPSRELSESEWRELGNKLDIQKN